MAKKLTQADKDEICNKHNISKVHLEQLIEECAESGDVKACVEQKINEAKAKKKAEETRKKAEEDKANFDRTLKDRLNKNNTKPKG